MEEKSFTRKTSLPPSLCFSLSVPIVLSFAIAILSLLCSPLLPPLLHACMCAPKGREEGGKSSSPLLPPPISLFFSLVMEDILPSRRDARHPLSNVCPISLFPSNSRCLVHEWTEKRGRAPSPHTLSLLCNLLHHRVFLLRASRHH